MLTLQEVEEIGKKIYHNTCKNEDNVIHKLWYRFDENDESTDDFIKFKKLFDTISEMDTGACEETKEQNTVYVVAEDIDWLKDLLINNTKGVKVHSMSTYLNTACPMYFNIFKNNEPINLHTLSKAKDTFEFNIKMNFLHIDYYRALEKKYEV